MNTKEIREKKLNLKPTKRQRDILVGLLLGDGHLETQNNGKTYRLKVEHSLEQNDYVEWLFDEFREWILAEKPYVKKRKNGQQSIGFTTYSHAAFRFYAYQFYPKGKKTIPKIIKKFLSPISIAVWFMDDGSRKSNKHKSYIIHTLGFSKQDLKILQIAIQDKFAIATSLHSQKKKYWRMYILSESSGKFVEIIRKYVYPIKSMRKKLVTQMPKK
jgi:hypothetical protein